MRFSITLICIFIILVGFACKETPPAPYARTTFLSAEDVGVTDAWLKLHLLNPEVAPDVVLKRDGQTILTARYAGRDTVLLSDSLLPKHTYTYRAYRLNASVTIDSSDAIQVTTMDTTNHNFTFQIDTLGDGNSSILRDVAIMNDTCVYGVGEVFLKDSTGQIDPTLYNLARWDGKKWNLSRVQFPQYNLDCTIAGYITSATTTIFALDSGNVILSDGGALALLRRSLLSHYPCVGPPLSYGQIQKIWGTSEKDFYCVGNRGTILHYASGTWQKLESGTTLPILDIWGRTDSKTGEEIILCVASDTRLLTGKLLLRIQGTTVTTLPDTGIGQLLSGVWFVPNRRYYVVGDGLYTKRSLLDQSLWIDIAPGLTQYAMSKVRGNGLNDVTVVGAFGLSLHFNGVSWSNMEDQTYLSDGFYGDVNVKDNILVAVGIVGNRAIVLRGYHH